MGHQVSTDTVLDAVCFATGVPAHNKYSVSLDLGFIIASLWDAAVAELLLTPQFHMGTIDNRIDPSGSHRRPGARRPRRTKRMDGPRLRSRRILRRCGQPKAAVPAATPQQDGKQSQAVTSITTHPHRKDTTC